MLTYDGRGASRALSLFCWAALSAARSLPGAFLSASGLSAALSSGSERSLSVLCKCEFFVPCSSSTVCLLAQATLRDPSSVSSHQHFQNAKDFEACLLQQKHHYNLPWGLIWEMSAQIQLSAGMDHRDSHSALFLQVMKWILHHILNLETVCVRLKQRRFLPSACIVLIWTSTGVKPGGETELCAHKWVLQTTKYWLTWLGQWMES